MSTQINLTENNALQNSSDHCSVTFDTPGEPVVNTYRCNQPRFTTANLWSIRSKKRGVQTSGEPRSVL